MYWGRPEESNQVKTRVSARIFGNGVGSVGCREEGSVPSGSWAAERGTGGERGGERREGEGTS